MHDLLGYSKSLDSEPLLKASNVRQDIVLTLPIMIYDAHNNIFSLFVDERSLAYIEALDAERDLAILAQHGLGIRPECARILRVLTALLKKAAPRGLSPFDIGSIMCR